jgi:hypothetical protein
MSKGKMGLIYKVPGNRTIAHSKEELAGQRLSDDEGVKSGLNLRTPMKTPKGDWSGKDRKYTEGCLYPWPYPEYSDD